MNKRVRSRVRVAERDFLQIVGGLSLLDKVKSIGICQSQHQTATTPHRTIATALVWPCDTMSHERKPKHLMDALRSGKSLESDPERAGGSMLKTWPDHVLEFYQQNCR